MIKFFRLFSLEKEIKELIIARSSLRIEIDYLTQKAWELEQKIQDLSTRYKRSEERQIDGRGLKTTRQSSPWSGVEMEKLHTRSS